MKFISSLLLSNEKKQWKFFLCVEFANYLGLQYVMTLNQNF